MAARTQRIVTRGTGSYLLGPGPDQVGTVQHRLTCPHVQNVWAIPRSVHVRNAAAQAFLSTICHWAIPNTANPFRAAAKWTNAVRDGAAITEMFIIWKRWPGLLSIPSIPIFPGFPLISCKAWRGPIALPMRMPCNRKAGCCSRDLRLREDAPRRGHCQSSHRE